MALFSSRNPTFPRLESESREGLATFPALSRSVREHAPARLGGTRSRETTMEFQHTNAPQEGASTELAQNATQRPRNLTNQDLRRVTQEEQVQHHVRSALYSLNVVLLQSKIGLPHKHWHGHIGFEQSFPTRAALELIRRATKDIEERIAIGEAALLAEARERQDAESGDEEDASE